MYILVCGSRRRLQIFSLGHFFYWYIKVETEADSPEKAAVKK